MISRIFRGIILSALTVWCHIFAQPPKVLKSTPTELTFRVSFPNPSEGHMLENQSFTIGLPTGRLPRLSVTPLATVPLSDRKSESQFYTPSPGYGEWIRLDRCRDLDVAVLKLSPTASDDAASAALELELTVRFPDAVETRPSLSRPEQLLYSHRILNWSVSKSWLTPKRHSPRLERRTAVSYTHLRAHETLRDLV